MARVAEAWEFRAGFPFPRFELRCPVCSSTEVGLKDWRFFERKGTPSIAHRCDVSAKCCRCSFVLMFGVPVPPESFELHGGRRRIGWRQVRELVAADGGGPPARGPRPLAERPAPLTGGSSRSHARGLDQMSVGPSRRSR